MLIVTDIDGVISDDSWRKSMLPDWDAYHAASVRDNPHRVVVSLLNSFHLAGHKVWAMTGRPEKWRRITNDWLLKHEVLLDHLVMRPDANFMSSPDLKLHLLSLIPGDNLANILVLDDRDDILTKIRGAGYSVMHVMNQRTEP